MPVRLKHRKQPYAAGNQAVSGNNVIRLSRTLKIEVQPEVLASYGIVTPGSVGGSVRAACHSLGTMVSRYSKRHKLDSLLVTSPACGAGTTVTAINLALQLTRQVNRTVLLVDLNLRAPRVHRYFNYLPEYGIADCIRGEVPLKRILFSPVERLTIAPACGSEEDSADLLSSPTAAGLLQEMISRYSERLVILDTPPVLEWDDVLALLPDIDASLLVVRAGETRLDQAQQALHCLQETANIGVVLNNAPQE